MLKKRINSKFVNDVSVIILAGGNSCRMTFPKLLLQYDENHTFIEKIVNTYLQLGLTKIVMVLNHQVWNHYQDFFKNKMSGVEVTLNGHPEKGRIFSIQLGLAKINTPFVFIQNTDNPFVKKELLNEMFSVASVNGYVTPRFNNEGGHPILLCGNSIQKVKDASVESSLKDNLKNVKRRDLNCSDSGILININNPEDYRRYFPTGYATSSFKNLNSNA